MARIILRRVAGRCALGDDSGQTLAEYGVLLTLLAVGVTSIALLVFGAGLSSAFDAAGACLDGAC